jgi:hypothetical protein
MSWEKYLKAAKTPAAAAVLMGYAVPVKRGNPRMTISIPTNMAGPWDKAERLDFLFGREEDDGLLMIKPGDTYKLGRLRHTIRLLIFGLDHIFRDDHQMEPVAHRWDGEALILMLPGWARGERPPEPPSRPIHKPKPKPTDDANVNGRPQRLSVAGNLLVVNDKNIRLNGIDGLAAQLLVEKFDGEVAFKEIAKLCWPNRGSVAPADIEGLFWRLDDALKGSAVELVKGKGFFKMRRSQQGMP